MGTSIGREPYKPYYAVNGRTITGVLRGYPVPDPVPFTMGTRTARGVRTRGLRTGAGKRLAKGIGVDGGPWRREARAKEMSSEERGGKESRSMANAGATRTPREVGRYDRYGSYAMATRGEGKGDVKRGEMREGVEIDGECDGDDSDVMEMSPKWQHRADPIQKQLKL
ncbi:hypothetical protein EDB84DRAFT_1441091 [Lactarius hengduanensis]|nr:hypothetical protein EDB84DRAFT_1441091 [Lactarius hengduanensis]